MNAKKKKKKKRNCFQQSIMHALRTISVATAATTGHVCMKPVIIFLRWNDASKYLVFETAEVISMGK
jgi:hypothetical protein